MSEITYASEPLPALDPAQLPEGTFLLHGQPRQSVFHLGHLYMLNQLGNLVQKGRTGTLLILANVDRSSVRDVRDRRRLREDTQMTREFYTEYLRRYNGGSVEVRSSYDFEPSEDRFRAYADAHRQAAQGSCIRSLTDGDRRRWADESSPFMARSAAIIELLRPDFVVCGPKHRVIARAFGELYGATGSPYNVVEFPDTLLDGHGHPMDDSDCPMGAIYITGDDSVIRASLNAAPAQIDSYIDLVANSPFGAEFGDCSRLKASEKIEVLIEFLRLVRSLLPRTVWNEKIGAAEISFDSVGLSVSTGSLSSGQRQKILKHVYEGLPYQKIQVIDRFVVGQSGSEVLATAEFLNGDRAEANRGVVKIGSAESGRAELENYLRFVEPTRTEGFAVVHPMVTYVDSRAAILYRNVGRSSPPLDGYRFVDQVKDGTQTVRPLLRLFCDDLYHTLYRGAQLADGSLRNQFAPLLPPAMTAFVDRRRLEGGKLVLYTSDPTAVIETTIREVLSDKEIRCFTETNEKIDVHLGGNLTTDRGFLNRQCRLECTVERDSDAVLNSIYRELLPTVGDTVELDGFGTAPRPEAILKAADPLNRQSFSVGPVHGDLNPNNVLFTDDRFSVIDYGSMWADGSPLVDISRLAAQLLGHAYYGQDLDETLECQRSAMGISELDDCRIEHAFSYRFFSDELQRLFSRRAYHLSLCFAFLGISKFEARKREPKELVRCYALANFFLEVAKE